MDSSQLSGLQVLLLLFQMVLQSVELMRFRPRMPERVPAIIKLTVKNNSISWRSRFEEGEVPGLRAEQSFTSRQVPTSVRDEKECQTQELEFSWTSTNTIAIMCFGLQIYRA